MPVLSTADLKSMVADMDEYFDRVDAIRSTMPEAEDRKYVLAQKNGVRLAMMAIMQAAARTEGFEREVLIGAVYGLQDCLDEAMRHEEERCTCQD